MTNASALIASLAVGFFLVILAIIVAFVVIMIVSNWKILTKANEEGWKSLIPFYNQWTLCEVIGLSPYWVIELVVVQAIYLFAEQAFEGSFIVTTLSWLVTLNSLYFNVVYSLSLAKSFGKDKSFGILTVFFPIITLPMLAFGKSQYVGKNGEKDPVMDFILDTLNVNKNNNVNVNGQTTTNYANVNQNTVQPNQPMQQQPFVQPQANQTEQTNNSVNVQMNDTLNQQVVNQNPTQSQQIETLSDIPSSMNVQPVNNQPVSNIQSEGQQTNKFCPNCGNKLTDSDIFCQNCGTKVN